MIVTIITFWQSRIRSVRGRGQGCLGVLVMKLSSSLLFVTHKHIHMHTLKMANFKGSKGTEHCDYDQLAMEN